VKLYATEILSILLQDSKVNQQKIGKLNGIEIMLTTVAANPSSKEEEFVENLFNCLCTSCSAEDNKKFFNQAEGLKLLQITIRNKHYTRKCALKLLDYILSNDPQNCRRWVQLPGLGTLFAAFMKVGSKKHKKGFSESDDDEHIISIISHLLRAFDSQEQGKLWSRVIDKFRENDHAKVERLLEMYEKYKQRVRNCDLRIVQERAKMERAGEEIDGKMRMSFFYMQRLDAGLFTLQLVSYILAVICRGNAQIKEKARQLLNLQDSSFEEVKNTLLEYAKSVGDKNEGAEQRTKILELSNELVLQQQ